MQLQCQFMVKTNVVELCLQLRCTFTRSQAQFQLNGVRWGSFRAAV